MVAGPPAANEMVNPTAAPKPKTKRDGLYVHPKGSITKPTKVSCASCISGHRSGACDHYDRILLQIRAAGRPSTTCHHQSSCGGACLQQKAFYVVDEVPHWCREHRSCVENWEHPDRCPPYPVSSTKSAKRKERSSSPQVPVSTSSTSETSNSQDVSNSAKSSAVASSCASEYGRADNPASLPAAIPIYGAAPAMVKASQSIPPTPWVSTDIDYSFHGPGHFNPPAQRIIPPPTSSLPIPQVSFAEASTLNSLGPSFDTAPLSHDDQELWKPAYDPFLPNFSFEPSEALPTFTSLPRANPFSLPTTATVAPTSYTPTATAPLRQRASARQTQSQQTHPCPGNGFQCPCDENCMCEDCYTHSRGFWTLPFSFADLPQEEYQPPPSHIPMPSSTFPESMRNHAFTYEFSGARNNSRGGLFDHDEDESKDRAFAELKGGKGGCCSNEGYEDWLA